MGQILASASKEPASGISLTCMTIVGVDVEAALAGSFLGALPRDPVGRLLGRGVRTSYPSGTTVYRQGEAPRTLLVVEGLVRVYMSSPDGREVTVRYARPCDVLGIAVLVGGPADVGAQTLARTTVLAIDAPVLTEAARRDGRVGWAIAEELDRRLYENLQQTAVNAFGTVREVVARVLRDLRGEGLVDTSPHGVRVLDPIGLHDQTWNPAPL
jgi:CRP/FNR family transcriptional regulator